MAPLKWMHSVRAVRDTLVADYSAPCVDTMRHVAYRPLIAVSLFHCFFLFCRSPILNDYSGIVANCDNRLHCVHWVCTCIRIAMRWVMLQKSLLAFLLPVCKMQFSLYSLSTSIQVARSMWLLTMHCWFRPSPVWPLVVISGITCV